MADVVHIRTTIPPEMARQLKHLAIDLETTQQDIFREAVLLMLHKHGKGEGLPDPKPPIAK